MNGQFVSKKDTVVSVYDHGLAIGEGKPGAFTNQLLKKFRKTVVEDGVNVYEQQGV